MDVRDGKTEAEKASTAPEQLNPPPYSTQGYMGYPQPGPAPIGAYPQQPYPTQQPYTTQQLVYSAQGQTVITVQQPTGFPLDPPENDYLGYSVFTVLFCFWPLGIAAVIHSNFVREANARGDRAEASQSSAIARILNHTSLAVGIVMYVALTITLIAIFV